MRPKRWKRKLRAAKTNGEGSSSASGRVGFFAEAIALLLHGYVVFAWGFLDMPHVTVYGKSIYVHAWDPIKCLHG